MSTRELESDNGRVRTWRVRDDAGVVIGWDHELIPTPTEANEATLQGRARSALATNGTYLAKATTTTAEDKAQIKALTRECSTLIRLLLNLTDTTDGT